MNPSQTLRNLAPAEELQRLTPAARKLAAQEFFQSQKSALPFPYWSIVSWQAAKVGPPGGPYTFAFQQGTRKAFSYGQGAAAQGAGFPSTFQATEAETNLVQAAQTNDNADFIITGVGVEICGGQDTEPGLIGEIFRRTSVQLALSGTTVFKLATIAQLNGMGGPYGAAASKTLVGALPDSDGAVQSYIANGNPMSGNYRKLAMPLRWNASGGGKKDSSLNIIFNQTTDFTWNSSADRAAAPGVAAFTVPDLIRLDLRVVLEGYQVSERSNNT